MTANEGIGGIKAEFFTTLLEALPASLVIMDPSGKVIYWNKSAERVFVWTAAEAINRDFFGLIVPMMRPEVSRSMLRKIEELGHWEAELTAKRRNGTEVVVHMVFAPIREKGGRLGGFIGIGTDLSERMKIEEALKVSELRYRGMVEDQTDVIVRFTPDLAITYSNAAFRKLFGEGRESLRGIFYPDDLDKAVAEIRGLNVGKSVSVSERRVMSASGEIRWMEWINRGIFGANGNLMEVQGVGRDITEQKSVEEALKENERRYRAVVDDQTELICRYTPDFKLTFSNAAYRRVFGEAAKDGSNILLVIPEEERPDVVRHLMALNKDSPVGVSENYVVIKGGEKRWIRWTDRAIFDDAGKLIEYQAVGTDLTERRMIEMELIESERRLREILNFLPDPTFVIDSEGKVIVWNRAAEKLTGIDASKMIGKGMEEYSKAFYGEVRPTIIDMLIRPAKEFEKKYSKFERIGDSIFAEAYISPRGIGRKYVIGHATPLYNSSGQVIGAIETFKDMTERKRLEEELRRYSQELEEVVKEKTEQLRHAERLAAIGETAAMVGHDLRNPLQALTYMIYLGEVTADGLKSEAANEELKALFGRMKRTIDYMNKIVLDVEDYARPIKPERVEVDVFPLVDDILGAIEIPKGIEVELDIKPDFKMYTDVFLLRRSLTNLITNAIQAMPDGGKLTVSAKGSDDSYTVFVSDTGVGIREENLKKIFQPLFTTKSKGQGMGLAVVKRIVEAQGGKITLETAPGKGTRFTIILPK